MVIVITVGNPPPPPQATAYILEDASSFNTYVLHTYIRIYYKENHFICYSGLYLAQRGAVFYTWPPPTTAYILEDASFNTYVLHTYIRIYYKENHFFGHTRTPLAALGPPWLHLAPLRLLHTYWRMPPLIHMYYILPGGRSEVLPTT